MAAIIGETKIFEKKCRLICRETLWVKNFIEIALCSTIFYISIFVFCKFCKKIRKFKMAAIIGETKIFGKKCRLICRETLWVKNFIEIALCSTIFDISIFEFCNFCEKFKNSKWPPLLARQFFFENWIGYPEEIFCGSKISLKLLYLARFSRYKQFCLLQFLQKIRKFKMAAIFGEIKFFWDNVLIN